jgi:hypothetical protein
MRIGGEAGLDTTADDSKAGHRFYIDLPHSAASLFIPIACAVIQNQQSAKVLAIAGPCNCEHYSSREIEAVREAGKLPSSRPLTGTKEAPGGDKVSSPAVSEME